jgi:predicted ABC-type ATPase
MMRSAKDLGYRVRLVYICLGDLDLHNDRVLSRVAQGGHDVAEADIGRRRIRSLARAPEAVLLADEALIFDNSDTKFQRVLILRAGQVIWKAAPLPAWAQDLLTRLE